MFVSKVSWRRLQDMSSRNDFKTSSIHFLKTSSRRFQHKIFYLPRWFEGVLKVVKTFCKMSPRKTKNSYVEDYWRRLQYMSCRPTNVSWESSKPKNENLSQSFDNTFFSQSNNWVAYKWPLQYAQLIDKNLFILFIINLSFGQKEACG